MYYSVHYLKEQPRARSLRKGKYSISTYTPKHTKNQKQNYQQVINISTFYQQVINMKGGFRGYGVTRARVYARARAGGGWRLAGD